VLPDDLPWVTGSIGMLGTKPSYDLMMECDTLLMIGSGFPYFGILAGRRAKRGGSRSISRRDMLSLRYPMEVNLVGDAAENAQCTAAVADGKEGRSLAQEHRQEHYGLVENP